MEQAKIFLIAHYLLSIFANRFMPMAKPTLQTESEEYEDQHVHQVYEQIASHFSSTRYKVGLPVSGQPISLDIHVANLSCSPGPLSRNSYLISQMDLLA